ncbi:hypothetical protein AKMU_01650 [Akkermansia muciniphila]|nr:hypothetical protein AKMU_01650 [Akkermansia muciniphila]GLU93110.1 hypothetical protein Amuc01_15540 [Akkermansia muciniphila]
MAAPGNGRRAIGRDHTMKTVNDKLLAIKTAWVNAWRADFRASRLARHPVMVYLSVAC